MHSDRKPSSFLRPILVILGVGAWIPVILMRHVWKMDPSFLAILPFLTLHVSCMVTLLLMRLKERARKKSQQ